MSVCTCGLCTKPRMGLLWSSPGVQLRVTARCLTSVIWRRTGGSGRSKADGKTQPITLNFSWQISVISIWPTSCLPHKVRLLLASAISSFVMIWQVYTPSSPGSTLEMIRSGPSNVYLRKNVAEFRFGNPYIKTFSTPCHRSYFQFTYLTFHHCATQRSSGHFSSTEGPGSVVWGL